MGHVVKDTCSDEEISISAVECWYSDRSWKRRMTIEISVQFDSKCPVRRKRLQDKGAHAD